MRQAGQGAAFLEKALHAVAKGAHGSEAICGLISPARRTKARLLGRYSLIATCRPSDPGQDRRWKKPAQRRLAFDRVFLKLETVRQGVVGLLGHQVPGMMQSPSHFRVLGSTCKAEIPHFHDL